MLIGNPVKPGSVVRGRKEPEELESERVKRAASELGAWEGKREPPVCRQKGRSPEESKVVRILARAGPWKEHLRELGCLAGKT